MADRSAGRFTRAAWAWALVQLDEPVAALPLMVLVRDATEDRLLRQMVVGSLGGAACWQSGQWARDALVALLAVEDAAVRRTVLVRLLATEWVDRCELVLPYLGAAEPEVRLAAVGALARLGSDPELPTHLDGLAADPDWRVRTAVARALHSYRPLASREPADPRGVDPLLACLVNLSPATRTLAIRARRRLGAAERAIEGLGQALADADPEVRLAAVEALGEVDTLAVQAQLERATDHADPAVRAAAVQRLAESRARTEAAADRLRAELTRRIAVTLLGQAGDVEQVPRWLADLAGDDDEARDFAADVLAAFHAHHSERLRGTGATRQLAALLADEARRAGWWPALELLRRLADPETAPALAAFVADPGEPRAWFRVEAIRALGATRDRRGLEALLAALADPETEVRVAAVEALASLDDPDTGFRHVGLRWLGGRLARLADPETVVREAAARAILAACFDMEHDVWELAYHHLGRALANPKGIALLRRALGDASVAVRLVAVLGACEVLPAGGVGLPVDELLADVIRVVRADAEPGVRALAAHALRLRDRRATAALVDALRDPEPRVRVAAAESLDDLRDPDTAAPLAAALGDADAQVRRAVAWALIDLGDPAAEALARRVLRDDSGEGVGVGDDTP